MASFRSIFASTFFLPICIMTLVITSGLLHLQLLVLNEFIKDILGKWKYVHLLCKTFVLSPLPKYNLWLHLPLWHCHISMINLWPHLPFWHCPVSIFDLWPHLSFWHCPINVFKDVMNDSKAWHNEEFH